MDGKPRKFFYCFLTSFAFVWIAVVALHLLGNPQGMFPSPLQPNHSNRAWKSRRVAAWVQDGTPPQIVILGSSRMMQASPAIVESITRKRTFNYSAVGSAPREYVAQLNALLHMGVKPEMLIVGVDERAMFGLHARWEGRLAEDWITFRAAPLKEQISRGWQAISQIDFNQTPRALANLVNPPKLPTVDPTTVGNFLCDDGYRVRAVDSMRRKRNRWDADARSTWLNDFVAKMAVDDRSNFDNVIVEANQKDDLDVLFAICKANGIKIKLIITPMQPAYAAAVLNPRTIAKTNEFAEQLRVKCQQQAIDYYDFRDMKAFDGVDYEFWDEQHPTPVNTIRMLNTIFDLKPKTKHPEVPDDVELVLHPPAINSLNTQ